MISIVKWNRYYSVWPVRARRCGQGSSVRRRRPGAWTWPPPGALRSRSDSPVPPPLAPRGALQGRPHPRRPGRTGSRSPRLLRSAPSPGGDPVVNTDTVSPLTSVNNDLLTGLVLLERMLQRIWSVQLTVFSDKSIVSNLSLIRM